MDTERARARGEFEELRLKAEQLRMAAEEARRALADATGAFREIEAIDLARVTFLSAQLVDAAAKLEQTAGAMARIKERYGF